MLSSFAGWMKPLHELPKTTDLVEWTLNDIAQNRENVFHKTKECLGEYYLSPSIPPSCYI